MNRKVSISSALLVLFLLPSVSRAQYTGTITSPTANQQISATGSFQVNVEVDWITPMTKDISGIDVEVSYPGQDGLAGSQGNQFTIGSRPPNSKYATLKGTYKITTQAPTSNVPGIVYFKAYVTTNGVNNYVYTMQQAVIVTP